MQMTPLGLVMVTITMDTGWEWNSPEVVDLVAEEAAEEVIDPWVVQEDVVLQQDDQSSAL